MNPLKTGVCDMDGVKVPEEKKGGVVSDWKDEAAFEKLFREWYAPLCGYAESILHDLENISCDLRAVLSAPEADGQFACRSTEYDYKLGPAYKKISEKWPGIRMYELCAIASAIVRTAKPLIIFLTILVLPFKICTI